MIQVYGNAELERFRGEMCGGWRVVYDYCVFFCWSRQDNWLILYYNCVGTMSVGPRRKESEIIEILFSNRKIDQLHEFLQQNPDLNLLALTDTQDNTILHQLAYEGHLDIIKLFVREIRNRIGRQSSSHRKQLYQKTPDQEIKNWMDRQNNEGFTALLYASYSGHLDVIQYLVQEHQVNYQLTTKSGLNPLHLAAQKNMIIPLMYFRERIDINSRDQLGSTPLHWAAYTNSEEVAAFLLAEPTLTSLDQQDTEGNTPLQLAVLYGNTRIVRRLLIKGSDRYIANHQNKAPLHIAKQNKFKTITRMLNQQFSCCDLLKLYCNVKIQYKPTNRKWTYPIIFLTTYAVNVAVLNLLITFVEWYPLYSQVIVLATMLILYLTLLSGPAPGQTRNYDELIGQKSQKQLRKLCFSCKNAMPRRGYHCDICKVCVQQYDHHCTWINNCVGKRNIGRFNFFLFFLILSLAFIGIFATLAEICVIMDNPTYYPQWFELRFQMTTAERICVGALLCLCGLTSLFIVPVTMLLAQQIKNLLKNKTTFEMLRKPQSQAGQIKEKMRKYNSKMSLRNCKMMCSDSKSSVSSFNTTNDESHQVLTSAKPSNH